METTTGNAKRLYKSRTDKMIDGVCGGIAEYFAIDPTIVRILWVLLTLLGGSGFVLYIAGMIIMPKNPVLFPEPNQPGAPSPQPAVNGGDKKRFWGILLILAGAFILLINLGWIAEYHWWSFSRTVILPSMLILIGGFLIYAQSSRQETSPPQASPAGAGGFGTAAPPKQLRRSITERKLFGVCGGIAKYFEIDPTIVRIIYIFLVLASFGWAILLYIILGLLMPEERLNLNPFGGEAHVQ